MDWFFPGGGVPSGQFFQAGQKDFNINFCLGGTSLLCIVVELFGGRSAINRASLSIF